MCINNFSLIKALMQTTGHEDQSKLMVTDGIDIKTWLIRPPKQDFDITYSIWDFAGQTVYYNTHQVASWHIEFHFSLTKYYCSILYPSSNHQMRQLIDTSEFHFLQYCRDIIINVNEGLHQTYYVFA